ISIFFVKRKKLLQINDKNHQFATAPFFNFLTNFYSFFQLSTYKLFKIILREALKIKGIFF
ncbi:hypothetical protein, partial [Fusobacterium hwasookii]|uniref:hypothetical protein n=1 Tax=Fusobacterium hwasookii TaxID=1583098 RepID=UPI001F4259B5